MTTAGEPVAEMEALSLAEMAQAEGWAKITLGSGTPPGPGWSGYPGKK